MAVIPISGALQRQGQELLHQQCWNWGRDIVRPEGNLLLEAGFVKQRPPEGIAGSTRYALRLADGGCWMLWGFGFFYATPELGQGAGSRTAFRSLAGTRGEDRVHFPAGVRRPNSRCDRRADLAAGFAPQDSERRTQEEWTM